MHECISNFRSMFMMYVYQIKPHTFPFHLEMTVTLVVLVSFPDPELDLATTCI